MIRYFIIVTSATFLLASCQATSPVSDGSTSSITSSISSEAYPIPDKLCALTFDDGPDVTKTQRVLDKLQKHGVVATFFVIGQLINNTTKTLLTNMVAMGCEIGNHSWGWDSLNNKTAEEIINSVTNTSRAIHEFAGVKPKFFRPPNLSASSLMYQVIDMPFVSGILGEDWAGCSPRTAQSVASNIILQIKDGAIILLHDVQPDPHPTPEALDILIPDLKKKGYEFVTLSELFSRKGIEPTSKTNSMWVIVK